MSDDKVGDRPGSDPVEDKREIVTAPAVDEAPQPPALPDPLLAPEGGRSRIRIWASRLLILALVASLFYLLAERNRRFYFLSAEGDQLVVSRGTWLPSWKAPYEPEDPLMAKAYAPIDIPEGEVVPQRRFDERQDLDQALFEVLIEWAQVRILADEPESLSAGTDYLERAALLPGISGEQFTRIRALRAEVAFSEGRTRLVEALSILDTVNERLALAASGRTARARRAQGLLQVLLPATESLADALQQMRAEPGSKAADLGGPQRPAPGEEGTPSGGAAGADGSERKKPKRERTIPVTSKSPARDRSPAKEGTAGKDVSTAGDRAAAAAKEPTVLEDLPASMGGPAAEDEKPANDRGLARERSPDPAPSTASEAAPKNLAHEEGETE